MALACAAVTAGACEVRVAPSADYKFLVASVPDRATMAAYRWLRNGRELSTGIPSQTFLLHADGDLNSSEGVAPVLSSRVVFSPGQWGNAFHVESGGRLAYPRESLLNLNEGTIEMWIAARENGDSPTYSSDVEFFRYTAPNGEYLRIAQAARNGTLYLGGATRGEWQSAYGSRGSMRSWKAGDWHHIAATFSAAENTMRFYVDGVRTADTNERHYWPPDAAGDRFFLGAASILIDEVRISSRSLSAEEVRASALRERPPAHREAWLPLDHIEAGDSILVESAGCGNATFLYPGIPITEVDPPSTVLPPNTTAITLRVRTSMPTNCRYSPGARAALGSMTAFQDGAGSTEHRTELRGLSPDPNTVNEVHVRCLSAPEYSLKLVYRSRTEVNPSFPRIGNLWGSEGKLSKGHEYAARIKGYFGAEIPPSDIRRLRELNPEIIILTSINTVENRGLPEDFYLHDTRGNRIEVWPGTHRLNLTKPYVAEYQARFAYQKMVDSNMLYDGVFFDNFFTNQAWLKADIHGTAVELDADEDGKPDDPKWLDAAWREGVFHELSLWRQWMPYALASGHLPRPVPPEVGEIFNGSGILFVSTNVIDGTASFSDLWDSLHRWWKLGRQPVITAIESSPPNQIAYGYGYNIARDMPQPTQEFGRTQYRYMRFALAAALMNDGYYWHDFGDISHGTDWWYDEYDFDLGHPLGAAELMDQTTTPRANMLVNSGFEAPLQGVWNLTISGAAGAAASVTRDAVADEGQFSALINVTNAGQGTDWHVDFNQRDRSLVKGVTYALSFRAKADAPREISLRSQKGSPDWRNYGLTGTVNLTTVWQRFTVPFEANETASDSRIQFFLGACTGSVWIDGVELIEQPDQVYMRRFTRGAVLLNGSGKRLTVTLPEGYQRFQGQQAPRHQYIVDDDSSGFQATGAWQRVTLDTGQWKSRGPFYHNWGKSCRKLEGRDGQAQWDLGIREDGTYTIETWWAAAPEQSFWSRSAVYEVVAGGKVVASRTLDQTAPGDQWRQLAEIELKASDKPYVRLRNEGTGAVITDAVYVWSAARYNDGSPAREVTVESLDGILLQSIKGTDAFPRATLIRHVFSDMTRKAIEPRTAMRNRNGVPLFPSKPGAPKLHLALVNRLRDED